MENPYLLIQSENALENKTLVERVPWKYTKTLDGQLLMVTFKKCETS